MAIYETSLGELLDTYVEPIARDVGVVALTAYTGITHHLKDHLSKTVKITIPDLGGGAQAAREAVADALAPIDPSRALRDIATAVSEAEKVFNRQNLAVVNGKVNVQLMVKVGDIAGAQAVFDLAIGPAPQA